MAINSQAIENWANKLLEGSVKEIRGEKDRDRSPFSEELRLKLFKRAGGKCPYCKITLQLEGRHCNLSIDHMHPVVDGGKDDDSNLQAVCKKCNLWKDDLNDVDFRKRIQLGRFALQIPDLQPMNYDLMQRIMNATRDHEVVGHRKTLRFRKRMVRIVAFIGFFYICALISIFALPMYSTPIAVVIGAATLINLLFAAGVLAKAWENRYLRWNPGRKSKPQPN